MGKLFLLPLWQRQLSAWRRFFDYLMRERVFSDNPARHIQVSHQKRRLPDVADVDESFFQCLRTNTHSPA